MDTSGSYLIAGSTRAGKRLSNRRERAVMEDEVRELLARDPFQPFHIKLANGDAHDVPNPAGAAMLERGLYIASQDGHWAQFPYDRVASLESLIELE